MIRNQKKAHIILEDGTELEGYSFGYDTSISGEALWYTGTQDICKTLTDPASRGAIIIMATSTLGGKEVLEEDLDEWQLDRNFESSQIQASGLVVADYCEPATENGTVRRTLAKWLKRQQVPALHGIDTRILIQRLRSRGSQRAKLLVSGSRDISFSSAHLQNRSTAVSTRKPIVYGSGKKRILVVDCGVRNSTIRALLKPDTRVEKLPLATNYLDELFDGLVIAGGPGDPGACEKTIAVLKDALQLNKPVFAVGQGTVILALAAGAAAFRMPQGHRGENQPCIDLETGRCYITAQNHCYGIRQDSLDSSWSVTFLNNNDTSIDGISTRKGLISGVLFQPEGSPGPDDTVFLYERFLNTVREGGITS